MQRMQQDVLAGPMRVPQLQRRRDNLASLETTLEQVAGVQQSQAAVQVHMYEIKTLFFFQQKKKNSVVILPVNPSNLTC